MGEIKDQASLQKFLERLKATGRTRQHIDSGSKQLLSDGLQEGDPNQARKLLDEDQAQEPPPQHDDQQTSTANKKVITQRDVQEALKGYKPLGRLCPLFARKFSPVTAGRILEVQLHCRGVGLDPQCYQDSVQSQAQAQGQGKGQGDTTTNKSFEDIIIEAHAVANTSSAGSQEEAAQVEAAQDGNQESTSQGQNEQQQDEDVQDKGQEQDKDKQNMPVIQHDQKDQSNEVQEEHDQKQLQNQDSENSQEQTNTQRGEQKQAEEGRAGQDESQGRVVVDTQPQNANMVKGQLQTASSLPQNTTGQHAWGQEEDPLSQTQGAHQVENQTQTQAA